MNLIIFTWLIYVEGEAIVQSLLFKYKKGYGHNPGDAFYIILFFIRGIVAVLHGAFVMDAQPGSMIAFLGFYCSTHWLLFDPTLNKLRGLDIGYEGANSGWLKGIPFKEQIIVASIGTVAFTFILYKLGYL